MVSKHDTYLFVFGCAELNSTLKDSEVVETGRSRPRLRIADKRLRVSVTRSCSQVPVMEEFSVGQIYRFCRKPRGRLPYSQVPLSVCDTTVHQTSPRTPLGPCTHLHTTSGTCGR